MKPFRGVITHWTLENGYIKGYCRENPDDIENIATSLVVRIYKDGELRYVETLNSRYLLIG